MILTPKPSFTLITIYLPGPDRKRAPAPYHFRITYRNPDPSDPGCLMTWDVLGGRETYQASLERTPGGDHVWHCSCPDAVYRGEGLQIHQCKHIRGLLELFETMHIATPKAHIAA